MPTAPATPDFFSNIVAALPAAIYATDARGRITYFNEAAAGFWGRRPKIGVDRWCGSWRLWLTDGVLLPHDECPMAVALKTGAPVRGAVAVAERPDGTRVPFTPFPTPMFDRRGRLTGGINMLVALTGAAPSRNHLAVVPAARATSDDRNVTVAALFDQTARLAQQAEAPTPAQWAILRFLRRARRERSRDEVATWLGVTRRAAAKDIAALVRLRLASEQAGKLVLTDSGRAALRRDPLNRLAAAVARLGEVRRSAFAADLEAIAAALARDRET